MIDGLGPTTIFFKAPILGWKIFKKHLSETKQEICVTKNMWNKKSVNQHP